jgi:hypothetical protein
MSLGKGVYFDREKLHTNFRYILLDLLIFENSLNRLRTILDKFGDELRKAIDDLDEEYIKRYIEVFNKKSRDNPEVIQEFSATNKILGKFVENAIFTGRADLDFEYFLEFLPENSLDVEVYLHYMFKENKINPQVFKAFFKFFPDRLECSCQKITTRINDVKFVEQIIDSLAYLPSPLALHILVYIHSLANKFLKLEVLKAMSNIDTYDRDFLLSILQKAEAGEKALAAAVLVRYPKERENLARVLLALPNPLGLRSSLIMTNLDIVEKLLFGEVEPYLVQICHYRFFWNRAVRCRAAGVLNKMKILAGQKKVNNNE